MRIGEQLARRRPQFGQGMNYGPVQPVQLDSQSVVYPSFRLGLDTSDAPENLDLDRAVAALDMEVTPNNRLIRAPGILQVSDETPRLLKYMFEQPSLDYVVELVAIDPPWLGYRDAGGFHWVDLGISATGMIGWAALSYLGDLLFSNGVDATYTRAPGAAVITDISAEVIARTFAEQFGRIFAGAYVDAGQTQALGIKWNDTSGLVDGWSGTGAGDEFLLSPDGGADQIVALRSLGFDLLAILMRNSLWAGYPTGRDTRPADFRFRIGGVGCVSERTARVTPGGATLLSDEGVVNYNVNEANVISGQINSELLPLDYTRIDQYLAAYQQRGKRYALATPFALYIYDFPVPELKIPGRWFKRAAVVNSIVSYTDQSALVTWDELIGTWLEQSLAWDQIGTSSFSSPPSLYFGKNTLLGKESAMETAWFGTPLAPLWMTPQSLRERTTDQTTTVGWEIIYSSGAVSTVRLSTPDDQGDFTNSVDQVLPSTNGVAKKKMLWNTQTGQGVQAQIEIIDGSPEILRLRQIVQLSGPTPTALP